jgi:hypothetical protein
MSFVQISVLKAITSLNSTNQLIFLMEASFAAWIKFVNNIYIRFGFKALIQSHLTIKTALTITSSIFMILLAKTCNVILRRRNVYI